MKHFLILITLLIYFISVSDIIAQCGAGTSVLLATQTDVNNFINNNCTIFLGSLFILDNNDGVDNITDLTSLSTLTSIGERLMIRNNLSLTSLNGLQGLTAVNGSTGFLLLSNPNLTNISSLSSLTTIGGPLTIQSNNMSSLAGLDNLSTISGNLIISNNDLLNDITSLNSLTSIDG